MARMGSEQLGGGRQGMRTWTPAQWGARRSAFPFPPFESAELRSPLSGPNAGATSLPHPKSWERAQPVFGLGLMNLHQWERFLGREPLASKVRESEGLRSSTC